MKSQRDKGHALRRAAKLAGATELDFFTPSQIAGRDHWRCFICGGAIDPDETRRDYKLSIDHYVALSDGGQHTWQNCGATHLICNSSKKSTRSQYIVHYHFGRVHPDYCHPSILAEYLNHEGHWPWDDDDM